MFTFMQELTLLKLCYICDFNIEYPQLLPFMTPSLSVGSKMKVTHCNGKLNHMLDTMKDLAFLCICKCELVFCSFLFS